MPLIDIIGGARLSCRVLYSAWDTGANRHSGSRIRHSSGANRGDHDRGNFDLGGLSKEITAMGVPCSTLRNTTKRSETVALGTNVLVGTDSNQLRPALDKLFAGECKMRAISELWDGRTRQRIVAALARELEPDRG